MKDSGPMVIRDTSHKHTCFLCAPLGGMRWAMSVGMQILRCIGALVLRASGVTMPCLRILFFACLVYSCSSFMLLREGSLACQVQLVQAIPCSDLGCERPGWH